MISKVLKRKRIIDFKLLCPGYMCITTKVDGCTTVKVEVDTLPQR
ncbi:4153_t:CDS:2 [Ambispora gerdemannii]|uniref:4153_t:CDS:1 n=1 Tax=Ambispora gerdemannii TaxID=144530 RepID=A0A9N8Z9E4_9GLOM|nr:4153_t:CDS:2 [Ambispora gerdemannii]